MTPDEKQDKSSLIGRRTAIRYSFWGIAGAIFAALTAKKADAGYGACSVPGCPCQGYAGSAQLCQNCGHQYPAHW